MNDDDINALIEDCGLMDRTFAQLERAIRSWEDHDSEEARALVKAYYLAIRRKHAIERALGAR